MPTIEIQDITPNRLEDAVRRMRDDAQAGRVNLAEQGMRAARARDPKLLRALDRGIEVLDRMAEDQGGRTRRTGAFAERSIPTEVTLWREAYTRADRGEAPQHFAWIYACAADLAGLRS